MSFSFLLFPFQTNLSFVTSRKMSELSPSSETNPKKNHFGRENALFFSNRRRFGNVGRHGRREGVGRESKKRQFNHANLGNDRLHRLLLESIKQMSRAPTGTHTHTHSQARDAQAQREVFRPSILGHSLTQNRVVRVVFVLVEVLGLEVLRQLGPGVGHGGEHLGLVEGLVGDREHQGVVVGGPEVPHDQARLLDEPGDRPGVAAGPGIKIETVIVVWMSGGRVSWGQQKSYPGLDVGDRSRKWPKEAHTGTTKQRVDGSNTPMDGLATEVFG